MGQEISGHEFSAADFAVFSDRLRVETGLLHQWFREGGLSSRHGIGGFELEAWLVNRDNCPAPINEEYLALLDDGLFSPELSKFNIELNSTPLAVSADALSCMERELLWNWDHCRQVAWQLQADLVMIGILPTVSEAMLTIEQMSAMRRYRALNEQVLRMRGGKPLPLEIHGIQSLRTVHDDVMLEAATTSFQVHLQVAMDKAARYYNSAIILSAPMVAISANSPLLFGKRLWQETRIPLFEQAVSVGGFADAAFGPVKRVSFGTGYVRNSLVEVFQENLEHFPVLLPVALDEQPQGLSHLRLHNGTIWRWNRPLVGFDDDGTPHLRLEHRVIPAGPSVVDAIANAAFFYGLIRNMAEGGVAPEASLRFDRARDNFYAAAQYGMNATVSWVDGHHGRLSDLLSDVLLPQAYEGLRSLGCAEEDIRRYLGIIHGRLETRQTGAAWQLAWLDEHGDDLAALTGCYREHQDSGTPVHTWPV